MNDAADDGRGDEDDGCSGWTTESTVSRLASSSSDVGGIETKDADEDDDGDETDDDVVTVVVSRIAPVVNKILAITVRRRSAHDF